MSTNSEAQSASLLLTTYIRLLQEHLGHASFNTTAKYRKIAGNEHRSWYDRLWNNREIKSE